MANSIHQRARILDVNAFDYDKKFAKAKKDWVWGHENPLRVIEWDEFGDKRLVEIGNLIRFHVRLPPRPNKHPRRNKNHYIEFSLPVIRKSFLAFDMDHPDQRMYVLLDPKIKPQLAARFYEENSCRAMPLNYMAKIAGGRHSRRQDYGDSEAKIIGLLDEVVYFVDKRGDGPSPYIHHMGEKSHHKPFLAIGNDGTMHIVGGNYTCPVAGITD
jgi:hypothetical protein